MAELQNLEAEADAQSIADHLKDGNREKAEVIFHKKSKPLMRWETIVLRERVFELAYHEVEE